MQALAGDANLKPKVFIGSSTAALEVAEAVQSNLVDLAEPEIWKDSKFSSTSTAIESLFKVLGQFDFALLIALPEDTATKRGAEYHTMRDNVLFEMGLFLGRLGRDRVFLIAPAGAMLDLPSDLTGVNPATYNRHASNLDSAVGASLRELRQALRAFVPAGFVFDARRNLKPEQLVSGAGRKHDRSGAPTSVFAEAKLNRTNEALEITRTNSAGHWDIDVRPLGKSEPTIRRAPASPRALQIDFAAKVTAGAKHIVRCVTMSPNWARLDDQHFDVIESDWTDFHATLKAPADIDVLVRLQDEVDYHPSGTLYIRNIAVALV
jgi:hypothetical protein